MAGLPNPSTLRPFPVLPKCPPAYALHEYMTVCIGALAQEPIGLKACIVLGFDYKVSNNEWGSESEYKFHSLSDRLVAVFAGAPGPAKELALMYQAYLKTTALIEATAVDQLREPWGEFKLRRAKAYVERTLCVSYQDFIAHGEQWFGLTRRDQCLDAIAKHTPNVQMIFAGFIGDEAVLYRLWDDVEISTTFTAIGSGAMAAEPALHAREHRQKTAKSQALYNVYEAKKISEASPFVGQKTRLLVVSAPSAGQDEINVEWVTPAGEKFLAKLFRKYGPRPMRYWPILPDGALQPAVYPSLKR